MELNREVTDLQEQYGSLEEIRAKLGLSRREICARLFVDPSAWSRWTAGGQDRAPVRVYKSLAALLESHGSKNGENSNSESISLGWKLIVILNTLALLYLIFAR